MWVYKTIIVPAELRDKCSLLCKQLAGGGGSKMFATPLYTNNVLTHYISCGMISEEFAAALDSTETLVSLCATAGIDVTPQQLIGIVAACDISDELPSVAMTRLGLAKGSLAGEV